LHDFCFSAELYLKGKLVPSVPIQTALEEFVTWLETHFATQLPVILVAHNGKSFDSRVLLNNIHSRADEALRRRFYALQLQFGDSMPLFKESYPLFPSYSLPNVYLSVFGKKFRNAHRASTDVTKLAELLARPEHAEVDFSKFVFSAEV
jgi:hypothetical protein